MTGRVERVRRDGPTAVGMLVLALAVLGPAGPAPTTAQQVGAALARDSTQVGDVVPVAVRVVVDPAVRVELPDTLPLGDAAERAENAARVDVRTDTLPDGSIEVTGVYSITPWRTGELALPPVELAAISGDEAVRTLTAEVPALTVVTVLPPDTAGIEPKPLKGVIGASWDWLLLGILLAILLALLGLLIWWWWRRRGPAESLELEPTTPPRDVALATLQRAREGGYIERGEWKPYYTLISEAVRRYAAALNRAWGEDLTTSEVLARMEEVADAEEAGALGRVLRSADRVKFARRRPERDEALADWEAARSWVERFTWPPAVPEPETREAA